MSLISCQDVVLGYEGTAVVRDLNFTVHCGDYLCIVGQNGSGKSTLIKTLLRLNRPLSGTITIGDGLNACQIGYLPQQTDVQRDFPASVQEIVRSGCLNRMGFRPFYREAEKQMARENMKKLGIFHLANRCYRELSGGQQQRVLLARALCATQKILLLDEPITGLDPKAAQEMYELVAKLNREDHITIIMVSHDMEGAISYASHILHVDSTPRFFGKTEDYLQTKDGKAYLSMKGENSHD